MSRQRKKHPVHVHRSIGNRNARRFGCEYPESCAHGNTRLRRVSKLSEQLLEYEYLSSWIDEILQSKALRC